MKKRTVQLSMAMLILSTVGLHANLQDSSICPPSQIVRIAEWSNTNISEFIEGKHSDVIFECPKGSHLPLKISIEGEILALQPTNETPLAIQILKTCYIRCLEQGHFVFSSDLVTWKEFSEFFTGKLGASLQVIEEGQPMATLQLELHQKV